MDNEELTSSANACKEAGLKRSAELLDDLSSGNAKAYMLVELNGEYNDEIFSMSELGNPQELFLDKSEAIKAKDLKNAQYLRTTNPFAFGYSISEVSDLPTEELSNRLSELLGREFSLDENDLESLWDPEPIFPRDVPDKKMLEIARLFKLEFFKVIETDVVV